MARRQVFAILALTILLNLALVQHGQATTKAYGAAAREMAAAGLPYVVPENGASGSGVSAPRIQERQEARADQDLAAQEGMQIAAEEMVRLTRWQIFLGWITAAGLAGTLALTARSLKQTRESLDLARSMSQLELGAYVSVAEVKQSKIDHELGRVEYEFAIKNDGHTPARVIAEYWAASFDEKPVREILPAVIADEVVTFIGPGGQASYCINSGLPNGAGDKPMESGDANLRLAYRVVYADIFGNERSYEVCVRFWGVNLEERETLLRRGSEISISPSRS